MSAATEPTPTPLPKPPRRWTRRALFGAPVAGVAALGWMRLVEPWWLEVNRHSVALGEGRLAEPIRMLHLSDLHASKVVPLSFIAEAVTLGLAAKPDVICLTGDYVTSKFPHLEEYRSVLKRLSAAAPTFASFGNHDGGRWAQKYHGFETLDEVSGLMVNSGIQVLQNTSQEVVVRNSPLTMVGMADFWSPEYSPTEAFATVDSSRGPSIVLSHNPDSKTSLVEHSWDVLLCGHTHGGQLSLPIIGTPFAPVNDHRFVQGLHRWRERWVHITRGVGNLHGMRLNCPPEVSILELA